MNAIYDLGEQVTILIIAHRLTTLRSCDKIIKIENDGTVQLGSYEEMLNK